MKHHTGKINSTVIGFAYLLFYILAMYLCIKGINEPNTAIVAVGMVTMVAVNFICLRKAVKWVVNFLDSLNDAFDVENDNEYN